MTFDDIAQLDTAPQEARYHVPQGKHPGRPFPEAPRSMETHAQEQKAKLMAALKTPPRPAAAEPAPKPDPPAPIPEHIARARRALNLPTE